MLAIIQRLDPPGVGARDLRECLLIQLGEQADTESLTYRLVHDAFPDLIAHRWNELAKRFGVEPGKVQAAGRCGGANPIPLGISSSIFTRAVVTRLSRRRRA